MRKLVALAGLFLVACGGDASTGSNVCTPPACAAASSAYAVEIVGNSGSTLPTTELTQVMLDSTTGVLALNLAASARVSGHVTSSGRAVPASVVLTRPSAIDGRPDVSYQASVNAADGSYTLLVPQGSANDTYTVRVRPADSASFPPLTLSTSIAGDTTLEVPLPSGNDLVHFHGTLADAVSVGISQAKVVLRDAFTLDDLSTTTTTTASGSFDLAVSPKAVDSANGIVLVAQHGDVSTGLITLTQPISAAQIDSTTAQPMSLALPALPSTTHLAVPVVGASSSGVIDPIVGATYRLVAQLGGSSNASVVHEVDGQTDASGKIQADLFSDASGVRTYAVTLAPPSDSGFETPTMPLTVSVGTSSGVTQQIMLATQPLITGHVLDPAGSALKGATVQPALSTVVSGGIALGSATPASTTTDASGRFALHLDPNIYDFDVSAPTSASLPRAWLSRQTISGDLDVGSVQMPSAVMFDVELRDANQLPVQATVRLYIVPAVDPDCAAIDMGVGTTCVGSPQLEAEVATGTNGSASILLPAQ